MNLGLQGKCVLVTGASSNIGRATAIAFGAEGARVAVGYHANEAGARQTAARVEEAGGKASTVCLDLADQATLEHAARQVTVDLGGVDVLVNNAVAWPGFPEAGELFESAPVQRMRDSLDANLLGYYVLSRALVGPMREQGWGRVVNISSGMVEDGYPGSAAYLTAKAGLHGLTRTMSRELASDGVLTNLVMAGFVVGERRIPEEMLKTIENAAATRRTTTAAEVASLVVFLCSQANTHVTGELIRADGHFLTPS